MSDVACYMNFFFSPLSNWVQNLDVNGTTDLGFTALKSLKEYLFHFTFDIDHLNIDWLFMEIENSS